MTMTLSGTSGIVTPAGVPINNAPAFSATKSTTQSVTSGVDTKLTFDTEEYDTNSNYDTSASRFTPTVAGYYAVTLSLVNSGNNTTGTYLQIRKNGTAVRAAYSSAASTGLNVTAVVPMNGSTDYLEGYGALVGTTPTVSSNSIYTFFQATMVRGS